jgi:hypothetical protein
MRRLVRLVVPGRLPLRRMAVIRHGIPVLPLPLLLQGAVTVAAHQLLRLPVQHEVRRGPVLEVPAEGDVLVAGALEERHLLVLGAVHRVQLLAGKTEAGGCHGVQVVKNGELDFRGEVGDVRPRRVICGSNTACQIYPWF